MEHPSPLQLFTKLQPNELRSLSPLSNIDLEAHSAGKSGFKSSVVFWGV